MRTPYVISEYAEWLDSYTRFVQANYGDGEWSCILGCPGQNCNGEHYTTELQKELIETILSPPEGFVWYGSNPGQKLRVAVENWIKDNHAEQRAWVYKEIISGANANGKLKPFIEAVRRRRVLLVGPEHLKNEAMHTLWNIEEQILVPTSNAFTTFGVTYDATLQAIQKNKTNLVLVCSGMSAKPLIHKLAKVTTCSFIDMGATLDPYVGVWSRNAYRKEEFQEVTFLENFKGIL